MFLIYLVRLVLTSTVADPGFPVGGAPTRWGGTNLRRVHFSVKTYVKMKEIDPVGGARATAPPWIRQCSRIQWYYNNRLQEVVTSIHFVKIRSQVSQNSLDSNPHEQVLPRPIAYVLMLVMNKWINQFMRDFN